MRGKCLTGRYTTRVPVSLIPEGSVFPDLRETVVEIANIVRVGNVRIEDRVRRGRAQELEVLLDERIADPVTTVRVRVLRASSGVNILATVVREAIGVIEAIDAHEEALTVEAERERGVGQVVVAEDGTSRQQLRRNSGRNRLGQVNVQVVTEELRVLRRLRLHDRAIHGKAFIHEDTIGIGILVGSNLATSLPFTIAVGAVDRGVNSAGASEVALVLAGVSRISNALRSRSAVNTREHQALNAVVRASLVARDIGLATIERIVVAVLEALVALEDAVTTSIEVSDVAVAVGSEGGEVDIDRRRLSVHIPTINSRGVRSRERQEEAGGGISARRVVSIKALVVA